MPRRARRRKIRPPKPVQSSKPPKRKKWRPIPPPSIYVIQAVGGGPVKIGHSRYPGRRLMELQIGHPSELRIVHAFPGGKAEERALHRRLKDYRIRGEWFEALPQVLRTVGLEPVEPPIDPSGRPYPWVEFDELTAEQAESMAERGFVYGPDGEEWVLEHELVHVSA